MTGRRRSALPKGISPAEAAALLASCDRRRALGRRDYAVLVTLLRLGLRAGEAAALTLDDIDWRAARSWCTARAAARIGSRCPPTSARRSPPTCRRRSGQRAAARGVLARRAPAGPLGRGGVSASCAGPASARGSPQVGAHRLRHTAACEMVEAGVPLAEIGQVLRHQSLRVDRDLRPGGPRPRCARSPSPGRKGAGDERAGCACRGLPAAAPRARLQAQVRGQACLPSSSPTSSRRRGHAHRRELRSPGPSCPQGVQPVTGRTGSAPPAASPPTCKTDRPGRPRSRPADVFGAPLTAASRSSVTEADIARLLEAARGRCDPPLRAATYEALFGLLAVYRACGSARRSAWTGDVDLDAGVLTIRGTASSAAPGSCRCTRPSASALRRYARRRDQLVPEAAIDQPFFVSAVGTTLGPRTRVPTRPSRSSPASSDCAPQAAPARIHDLGTALPSATLIAGSAPASTSRPRSRCSPPTSGTSSPAGTYWYLSAVPELMELAAARLDGRFGARR